MLVKKNVSPKQLKPHPLNERVYGRDIDPEIRESIRRFGILQPIVVSAMGFIVSGHQRWLVATELDLNEVPIVQDMDLKDDVVIQRRLIEANRQRVKTAEQIAREFEVIAELEGKSAKGRQAAAGGPPDCQKALRENFSQALTGRSKDIAAEQLGVSRPTAEKALEVVKEIDKSEAAGDTERAGTLRKTLNGKSVSAAHRMAKPAVKQPSEHESLRKLIGEISRKCDDLTKRLSVIGFSGFGIGVVLEELQTAKDWLSDQK